MRRRYEVPASGASPNLILAPEDFSNAAWTKVALTITTDMGDATHPTADQVIMPNSRQLLQNSTTAATAGGNTANITITSSWARYSSTGTIDGLPYTYSIELLSVSGATALRLGVNASGGFIQVTLFNQSGSPATFLAYGAKLEQAASFSSYP